MSFAPMSGDDSDITDDAILNGRLRLFQPRRGHRFGHDAILLAAATPAKPGDRVAELGAGVGAASLALLARVPDMDATLMEIDPALTALASENIARNGFGHLARAVTLDVTSLESFGAAGLQAGSFDQVLMNPPFNDAAKQPSPHAARRSAHVALDDTLALWLRMAAYALKPGGVVSLIWRANAQDKVLQELGDTFGQVELRPVHPYPDRAPIRILVNARKGGHRHAIHRLPALTLADHAKQPSAEAEAILRGGMPLPPAS
jgi:tRNA1(Val) A37 N6-methylase TrmN6